MNSIPANALIFRFDVSIFYVMEKIFIADQEVDIFHDQFPAFLLIRLYIIIFAEDTLRVSACCSASRLQNLNIFMHSLQLLFYTFHFSFKNRQRHFRDISLHFHYISCHFRFIYIFFVRKSTIVFSTFRDIFVSHTSFFVQKSTIVFSTFCYISWHFHFTHLIFSIKTHRSLFIFKRKIKYIVYIKTHCRHNHSFISLISIIVHTFLLSIKFAPQMITFWCIT